MASQAIRLSDNLRSRFSWSLLALVLLGTGASLAAAEPSFPTSVGSRWTYDAGPVQVIEEIVAIEEVRGESCLRVETRVHDQVLSFEHLALRADGLYRVSIGGEEVVPPLCFFKFSPRPGEKWKVKSKVGDLDVSGNFAAGKSLITVPAGQYSVTTSHGSKFQSPGGELDFTYFYAPGVGKVKQIVKNGSQTMELSLKEFRPGENRK